MGALASAARADLRPSLATALATLQLVDLLDLAGRIQADPQRVRVSTADQLALAIGVERMWEVCLSAIAAVRTVDQAADAQPADAQLGGAKALYDQLLNHLSDIRERMAALTGTYEEN